VVYLTLGGGGFLVEIYPGSAAHGAFGCFVQCGIGFFVGVEAAVVAHVCLREWIYYVYIVLDEFPPPVWLSAFWLTPQ
jgi:hypothetical protein